MKKLTTLITILFITLTASVGWSGNFMLGEDAYKKGDYKTALKEIRPLADQGDVNAQKLLGHMYYNGFGVPQDYKKSFEWTLLSAEQGDAEAQVTVAALYYLGQGIPENYKESNKWYMLAAKQGNSSAQQSLGNSYELGEGVLQDFVLAHMWYNISAANGYKIAFENRNNVSKRMSKDQIEKAQDFARKCLESNYINCGY